MIPLALTQRLLRRAR